MGEVGFLVGWMARVVGCPGGSVLTVAMAGGLNNIRVTSAFGFQLLFVGYPGVLDPCTLQISCGT